MKSKLMVGSALALSTLAWAAKDPIVMKVNGVDVTKSEFEYLYKKNSQQQIEPQPLDKYVDMFAIYKMKVADAKANGLDTLPDFIKEMDMYKRELAAPYLTDSVYINSLVEKTLDQMGTEAEARHIMLFKDPSGNNEPIRQRADSIRKVLLKGADFAQLAKEYSQDQGSNGNGGEMGFIAAGKFPYSFEQAVFTTPEGKYSEVVESPSGYHIVKGGKKIPSRGKVQAAHIMKAVKRNATEAEAQAAKEQIDSIYQLVSADPNRFEELAMEFSDDPQSGKRGGLLPIFGSGDMVPQFTEATFALKDGEVSEPIESVYGWHIIKRLDSRPLPDKETMRPHVMELYTNPASQRSDLVREKELSEYRKRFSPRINDKLMKSLEQDAYEIGVDSALIAKYSSPGLAGETLVTVNKKAIPVSAMLPSLSRHHYAGGNYAKRLIGNLVDNFVNLKLQEEALLQLEETQPEYRNLVNEYKDGSLLYEISVRRVWDKASKDTEGLEKYFEEHRSDFAWKEPHVKGFLVQAANDSVADAVRLRLQQLDEKDYIKTIRNEFKGKASIDRVLTTKGQNPLIDNLVFEGDLATPSNPAYTRFFLFDQKMLMAPETVQDAKVVVTNAYQNELENQWIDDLKAKYPVEINEKVLKKIK